MWFIWCAGKQHKQTTAMEKHQEQCLKGAWVENGLCHNTLRRQHEIGARMTCGKGQVVTTAPIVRTDLNKQMMVVFLPSLLLLKKKQGTRMRNTQKKMLNKYIALSACRCCQELYSGSTTAAEEMQRTNGSARTQAVWQKRQMVPLFLWLFRKVCDA